MVRWVDFLETAVVLLLLTNAVGAIVAGLALGTMRSREGAPVLPAWLEAVAKRLSVG